MSTNQEKQVNAFDRYQEAAARTANMDNAKIIERLQQRPELLGLVNDALGVAGEAGEIADHIKKVVFHGHDLEVENLIKEVGDEFWYLADIARRLKVKLSTVAGINIKKLQDRYPEGFDEQRSINREG